MSETEVLCALERSELFSCRSPDEIRWQTQSFPKGSRIPSTLDGEPAVGLVVQGRVQVYSIVQDDAAVNLSTLGPGESFGISNIFSGEDLSTVLTCDRKTSIAYISRECIFSLLEAYPQMMRSYVMLCNRKIKYLTQKIEALSIPSCRARLESYLLRNQKDGLVHLECSKERLAHVLGVSRASLFRELGALSREGRILVEGRNIRLLNRT